MEEPERKFNLVSCLIISVIGSFFGALGITGLIVPLAQFVLSLLPTTSELGIRPEVVETVCRGVFLLVPAVLVVAWLARTRSRKEGKAAQHQRRARLNAFTKQEDETGKE